MIARFRARAQGGITPREVDRRIEAVERARKGEVSAPVLPPPMPHFGGRPELRAVDTPSADPADRPDQPAAEPAPPAPVSQMFADRPTPIVTITLGGPPSSGKSALAHLIRHSLAYEGISASGPDDLPSMRWHRALEDLSRHGLRVILIEEEW